MHRVHALLGRPSLHALRRSGLQPVRTRGDGRARRVRRKARQSPLGLQGQVLGAMHVTTITDRALRNMKTTRGAARQRLSFNAIRDLNPYGSIGSRLAYLISQNAKLSRARMVAHSRDQVRMIFRSALTRRWDQPWCANRSSPSARACHAWCARAACPSARARTAPGETCRPEARRGSCSLPPPS